MDSAALKLLPGEYSAGNIVPSAAQVDSENDMEVIADEDFVESDTDVSVVPLEPSKVKNMNKKQKKHLQESCVDLEKEDCAMWSSLTSRPRRPSRMLPRGCRTFLMEMFAGAATLSYMAVQAGMPISEPMDVLYDSRFNLLDKNNRDRLEKTIMEEGPYLLTLAPVCGPWSSWQFVNMAKSEDTREKIDALRKE